MNLLSADNISKNYTDRWLFEDLILGCNNGTARELCQQELTHTANAEES